MLNTTEISSDFLKYLNNYNTYITIFEDKNTEGFFIKVECTLDSQFNCKEFEYTYQKYIFKKKYYAKENLINYLNNINCNRNDKYTINNLKGILTNDPFPLNLTLFKISNKNLFYGQLDNNFNIKANNQIKSIYYNIVLNNHVINFEEPLIDIKYPFFPNCLHLEI